jgi:hypothetical protein
MVIRRCDTVDWALDWEELPTGRWRARCWVMTKRRRSRRRYRCRARSRAPPLGGPLSLG